MEFIILETLEVQLLVHEEHFAAQESIQNRTAYLLIAMHLQRLGGNSKFAVNSARIPRTQIWQNCQTT